MLSGDYLKAYKVYMEHRSNEAESEIVDMFMTAQQNNIALATAFNMCLDQAIGKSLHHNNNGVRGVQVKLGYILLKKLIKEKGLLFIPKEKKKTTSLPKQQANVSEEFVTRKISRKVEIEKFKDTQKKLKLAKIAYKNYTSAANLVKVQRLEALFKQL